ncbi:hypothetical protein C2S51_015383 [Perilla frutescens var. frutescens]|nr:hypothetical protein C2S51_015383 [Perilla frutescens var. frutescens]
MKLQLVNGSKEKGIADDDPILGDPPPVYDFGSEGQQFKTQSSNMNKIFPDSYNGQCNEYFKEVSNIPDEQKIILASTYFEGRAAAWFQTFSPKYGDITWKQLVEVVLARFENIHEAKIGVEFDKLKYRDYQDYVMCEEVRECILLFNQGAHKETYAATNFSSGLIDKFMAATAINMFDPGKLERAMELGNNHLITMEAFTKMIKENNRYVPNSASQNDDRSTTQKFPSVSTFSYRESLPLITLIKLLTTTQLTENRVQRRAQRVCYNCEDELTPWHNYKHMITNGIMIEEDKLAFMKVTNEEEHLLHLERVFPSELKENTLFSKQSKCHFGQKSIEYLGHIIIDPQKFENMVNWPTSKIVQQLKKDGFKWSPKADQTFNSLKEAITNAQAFSVGEGEFWVVQRWKQDMRRHKFVIWIDQQALKYVLNQRLVASFQSWITKILWLDYEMHYMNGCENGPIEVLATATPTWLQKLLGSYKGDSNFDKILNSERDDSTAYLQYTDTHGLRRYKEMLAVVGNN